MYICIITAQHRIVGFLMISLNNDISYNSSKVQQLVDEVIRAIRNDEYKVNDTLPSVNQLSGELGLSRDTVFKAYKELKQRGWVESTPAKAYRVIDSNYLIFLFLDTFSSFKDELYKSFTENLPPNYQVDIAFHHYNREVFNAVIHNAIGKYNMYLIMNDVEGEINPVLKKLDPNKVLLLDWGDCLSSRYSFLCQDFDASAYQCIEKCAGKILKYKHFCYVYPEDRKHPVGTVNAINRFCKAKKMKAKNIIVIDEETVVPGNVYFMFRQLDLVRLAKVAKKNGLKIGADIGVIAYNETPLYEFIENGITTISTDFRLMGEKAAGFVKEKIPVREFIPARLTIRASL